MNFRLLEQTDFTKGFLELLSQLTTIGNISKEDFFKRFGDILKNKNHRIYVLEKGNKIVSCATLFVEPKFIHDCGLVGHVEDVVVDKCMRGQNMGKRIINFLTSEAERLGCYKILLDCSDKNVGFYEKCDYLRKGAYMAKYLNPTKTIVQSVSFFKKYQIPIYISIGLIATTASYYIVKHIFKEDEEE